MYKIILGLGLINLTLNYPLLVALAFVGIYIFENTTKEEKETINKIIMSIYSNGKEFSSYLVNKARELGITVPELRKKIVIDLEIPEVEVKEETADSEQISTEDNELTDEEYYYNYQLYNPEVIVDQNDLIDELNRTIYSYETLLEEKGSKIADLQSKLQKAEAANYVTTEEEDLAFKSQCDEYIADMEKEEELSKSCLQECIEDLEVHSYIQEGEIERLQQQVADLESKLQKTETDNSVTIEEVQEEPLIKTTPGESTATWIKDILSSHSIEPSEELKALLNDHEFMGDHIEKSIIDLAIEPDKTWVTGTLEDCFPIEEDECKIAPAGYRDSFKSFGLSTDNWHKTFTPKAYRKVKAHLKAIGRAADGSIENVERHNEAMLLLSCIETHFTQGDFIEIMAKNQYTPNQTLEGVF